MENEERLCNLTSGELAYLWSSYVYESMTKYGLMYFLQHVEDQPTRELMEESVAFSTARMEKVKEIFIQESYPVPQGFTEGDINLNAPRLFSDALYLEFILHLIKLELPYYSLAFVEMTQSNLQAFYQETVKESMELEMKIKELVIDKGLFITPPRIPTPNQIDFITKDSFLAGWFGEKRPLLGIEISHLVFNAKRNGVGQAVITGFSQVAQSKEVRKFFERGREIAGKQLDVFSKLLQADYLPTSSKIWTSEVTNSTTAPFSDKMMMQLITTLISSGMSSYGSAMAMSARRDLGVQYTRLLAEVAQFADDGAEIIIKNGWMEQPPIAADRKKLAK